MVHTICDVGQRLHAEGRNNPGWYVTLPSTNTVLGPWPTEQGARRIADAIDREILGFKGPPQSVYVPAPPPKPAQVPAGDIAFVPSAA